MINTFGRRNMLTGRSPYPHQTNSEYRTVVLSMEQTIKKDIPRSHKPCNDEVTPKDVSDCIGKYLSGLTGCKFPWLDQPDSNLSLCQTEEDYDSFIKHVSLFMDSGETAIYAKSKCVAPCTLNVYEPKKQLIDTMSLLSVTHNVDAMKAEIAKYEGVQALKSSGYNSVLLHLWLKQSHCRLWKLPWTHTWCKFHFSV